MKTTALANIPAELQKLHQFVCVNNDSKIPKIAATTICASVSDPSTWSDFASATNAVERGINDGLGFVFTNSDDYVGIDLDAGFSDDGFITREAAEIIEAFGSYTEKSRSGRGFHILVKGRLPFDGRNNRAGIEIYQAHRYFIFTGNVIEYSEIKEAGELLDAFLDMYFAGECDLEEDTASASKIYEPTWSNERKYNLHPKYPSITNGSRNVSLLSLAGSLRNQDYSTSAALKELQYVNTHSCDDPLPLAELKSIVRSAWRYKKG